MSSSTRSIARFVAIIFGLSTLACFGDFCQDATSTVVEGTVKGSKQVTKGIVEGVKEGRKAGESVDGATIVTTMDELTAGGSIAVLEIAGSGAGSSTITLAVENTTEAPMRISGMEYNVLDTDGFTANLTHKDAAKTVAPKSKDKITVEVPLEADKVGTIRLWGQDLEIPEGARKAAPAAETNAGGAE